MRITPDSSAFVALARFQETEKRTDQSSSEKSGAESAFKRTLANGADIRPVKSAATATQSSNQYTGDGDAERPTSTREAPTRGQRPRFQPKGQSINILV